MSMISKYAFANKTDAEQFQKKNGGKILSYDKTYAMVKKALGKEKQMIGKKRARKMFPMGKKIYLHKCDQKKMNQLSHLDVAAMKKAIMKDKVCGDLKMMQVQMVALYTKYGRTEQFKVPHDAKCPVCGMFVAKYSKWAVLLESKGHKHYFDGVKDFFKFYRKNPAGKVLAKDFYTLKDVDLSKAYMVKGSDVFGPMGHELIPFTTEKDAKTFMKEHRGQAILRFKQVTTQVIKSLDE